MKTMNKWWIWAIAISIITVVAMLVYPPVFYLNDDVTMRSILSGAYTGTPDGHAVYMQYPLTGLIAMLYRVIHFVPWFELFLVGCIWGCMVLLIYHATKPYVGFGIAVVLYLPFCFYMHYTIVAALLAGTASFLIATKKKLLWPIVLFLVAYMIRGQIGLLSLPFVAAAMVWRLVVSERGERKQEALYLVRQSAVMLTGILLCALINRCFYISDDWKQYLSYNDSRTLLYDYTDFLSVDSYAQTYEEFGMTTPEYEILASYDTMLTTDIDAVKMQEIAERVSNGMKSRNSVLARLQDVVRKYYLQIRYNDKPFNYLWIGIYLVLGIGFVVSKKWMPFSLLGILAVGRSSIWMYLIWQGRFPERVSLSLYILEIMVLLGLGTWFMQNRKITTKAIKAGIFVICGLTILASGLYQWQSVLNRVSQQAQIQSEWNALKWYCEEENERLYLVDVFSVVEYADFLFSKDAENIMLLGGWLTASPLAQERFEDFGYKDGAECLYYGKNVSLIVEDGCDVSWLEKHLQNRFGECKLKVIERIYGRETKGFLEYRVVRSEE